MNMTRCAFVVTILLSLLARASLAQTNHRNFDELLKRHVTSPFGLVDYGALRMNHGMLDAYFNEVAQADLKSMEDEDRLAPLINLYNAAMIKVVLEHFPIGSIKDIPPNEVWQDNRWSIGAKTFTLDQIRDDLIMKSNDPRALFAIVDAARGSGPLRTEAYNAESLNAQLNEQMRWTHQNGSNYVSYDPETKTLKLSEIHKRFKPIFVKSAGSLEAFVAKYNPEVKAALDAGVKMKIEFTEFDWRINTTGCSSLELIES
ncbi:MAG TPA: DUF547 domain-containing protein [Tepidisphaeraceae bacterium]|nr:DUF547 domain-containing protein [Tepidisphaeraceae bacterium]